jgi:hypothetical protein
MKSEKTKSLMLKLCLGATVVAAAVFGSSCAYNQVMDERNAERVYLEKQLDYEHERNDDLQHQHGH